MRLHVLRTIAAAMVCCMSMALGCSDSLFFSCTLRMHMHKWSVLYKLLPLIICVVVAPCHRRMLVLCTARLDND